VKFSLQVHGRLRNCFEWFILFIEQTHSLPMRKVEKKISIQEKLLFVVHLRGSVFLNKMWKSCFIVLC